MDEIEKGLKDFLDYWFAGCMRGLEELDEPSRHKVLSACGKACAESYTIGVFREVKEKSADLDSFWRDLSARGSASRFEKLDAHTVRATFAACGCDLVRLGMVKSPVLCECSAAALRENIEQSWGIPVSVTVETSILRGGKHCVLIVTLPPAT